MALGGRILPPRPGQAPPDRPEPKYKNSQESPIYSKRRTLYALNWAKQDIIAQGEVVVCEGYTDVIGCFEAGVPWAVATCGTALAEEHFTLLRNFAKRIVLAYDADSAGQTAASRVYEWERKHEVDVVVADLPGGSDPGDLARTDPEGLARAVKEARPFLQFRVDRMLATGDLTTPEGRARAAEHALAAVAEHPDDLVRDQYVMQVADRCRLDMAKLRERLDYVRAHPQAIDHGMRKSKFRRDEPPPRDYPDDDAYDVGGPDDRGGGAVLLRPSDLVPGSRPSSWPSIDPMRSLTVSIPCCSSTPCNGRRLWRLKSTTASMKPWRPRHPRWRALLRRVTVEEPMSGDPDLGDPVHSVVSVLVREAVRRALGRCRDGIPRRGRVMAGPSGRDGTSAALAGPTRRCGGRARRRRPVGSVVERERPRGVTTLVGRA